MRFVAGVIALNSRAGGVDMGWPKPRAHVILCDMETPRVPASNEMHRRWTLRTRWSDEDNQAVLNNAVYLTLLEETRHRLFGELGLLEDNKFPFVLAQTNIAFLLPGRGGVDVVVEVATTHVGQTSFTQAYRVIEVSSGAVWCEAEARLVAWDPSKRQRGTMSETFRTKLVGAAADK
jgi:acyl-CoA thioesterase FadM